MQSAAALHVSDPAQFRDALVAATELAYDLTVVTRDRRDFERYQDVRVLDPWDPGSP